MDEELLQYLLKGTVATSVGPTAKEFFLLQAEEEYNKGNFLQSIFYQVRTLFQACQDRYYQLEADLLEKTESVENNLPKELYLQMNDWEQEDFKSNTLLQYAYQTLNAKPPKSEKSQSKVRKETTVVTCNFLQNITDPLEGVRKIEVICQKLPKEWTVLQICKGPRVETTYSTFPQIYQRDAAIYITLFRHVRSADYPAPICLRFTSSKQEELYKKFACIAHRFKQSVNVDPKVYTTKEAKQQYWSILDELNKYIATTLGEFKNFFYPWRFIFTGKPLPYNNSSTSVYQSKAFLRVDDFCNEHCWEPQERVLLSLTALHILSLSELELHAICNELTSNDREQMAAVKMLNKLKSVAAHQQTKSNMQHESTENSQHYPCILIVDERLDHFFWEELNVQQEFCRANSLQCLFRLQQHYKERIHNGYLRVSIEEGGCVVNPDNNLPKTELRMRRFFEYWTPHWQLKFAEKPTHDELVNDYFKRPCYVYAGHGSGLQYINGKHIARQRISGVVFLFGCDSSRLHSNGLYSELVGPHHYYHAAMCPTLVGTLMPALDANMDSVAADILSRWIAPHSPLIPPWSEIDRTGWVKRGVIKPKCNSGATAPTTATTADYHEGSLCAILARVHQRLVDQKYYNTVPYVCRGLPVWNCHVKPLP